MMKLTLFLLTALLFACSEEQKSDEDITSGGETGLSTFVLSTPTLAEDRFLNLNAYCFSSKRLDKSINNIKMTDNKFTITINKNTDVYFVSNLTLDALNNMQPGMSTQELLELTTDAKTSHSNISAPEFFSGLSIADSESQTQKRDVVKMERSVARLDFNISNNNIKIDRIVVSGASKTTRLFKGSAPLTTEKISYERIYTAEDAPTIDQFRIYESSTPIKVSIFGKYNGVSKNGYVLIPEVNRSTRYRININGSESALNGSIETLPWSGIDSIDANPDINRAITIDAQNSIIPEHIEADYAKNTVNLSSEGGEFTLAFRSGASISIASVDNANADLTYSRLASTPTENGVITTYRVTVRKQANGMPAYTVKLNLKNDLLQNSYDKVEVSVDPSQIQIETVTFGGQTWMAFNATTPKIEDQIFIVDNKTVKEIYDKDWINAIGGLFQWGSVLKHVPWLASARASGIRAGAGAPWNQPQFVPCPSGFRVPSEDELRKLLPNDLTIPGTYLYDNETIAAALHKSNPEVVTAGDVTGTARYISLTSNTGAVMYLPLAGYKKDKSVAANPEFGSQLILWTSALDTGGYAWIVSFTPNAAANGGTVANKARIAADAYAYLRCIKQ